MWQCTARWKDFCKLARSGWNSVQTEIGRFLPEENNAETDPDAQKLGLLKISGPYE